ncbi:LMF2 factor, partial [Nothocercus julius]|nr:LMF2 factor [Nothocercus julius]
QVGQVFLYFQWDSLLLEAGFLAVLVAPLHLLKWRSTAWRPHDAVTFWLVRWLLFRLMFASGVVKLTSRCPTWWGLTGGRAAPGAVASSAAPAPGSPSWPPGARSFLCALLELAAHGLLLYWSAHYFSLEVNWEKRQLDSKVAFTYHEFTTWLQAVTLPLVGLGFLSLSWEILAAVYRCLCVRGCFWKLWATLQWAVFATATMGMFAVSLVPFTYIDYQSNGKLWPGIHQMFNAVERFQLVNSYGLFRRMTGVGGRPEVVLEGSYDQQTWTEIEFMYKPGNVSAAPPLVAPHQPRLDWQMWFAALAPHSSSPWFTSFVYRLLQGKRD